MNILKKISAAKVNGISKYCKVSPCLSYFHSSVEVHSPDQEVVIALGSNVGDRIGNFDQALKLMRGSGIQVAKHACLYETAPAYVTDQPRFLNSAVRAHTKLGPHELLEALKKIEREMGRASNGVRYGPRPIDLDIIFYGKFRVSSDVLTIPHERIWERPFVVAPVMDLLGMAIENDTVACWHAFSGDPDGIFGSWEKLGGESLVGKEGMKRVLPINNGLWDWTEKTSVMGVLNLTPDSFSDGGKFRNVNEAVSQVRSMISEGADMIDIGAQSTRPMASRVSPEEEMERLIPVLEAVLETPEAEGKLVSIDTFYSSVASEAISSGAHLVNDVSAGSLDPEMLETVAKLGVPYAAMHMRGDPSTMQSAENLRYEDGNVGKEVASELLSRLEAAELSGIPAWRVIVDPGLGFSKNTGQNLDVLNGLPGIRAEIAKKSLALSRSPLLIGPSRKSFLGEICSRPEATERDPATIAAVTAAIFGGANIVRVHNVRDNVDAVKLCDAMSRRNRK